MILVRYTCEPGTSLLRIVEGQIAAIRHAVDLTEALWMRMLD